MSDEELYAKINGDDETTVEQTNDISEEPVVEETPKEEVKTEETQAPVEPPAPPVKTYSEDEYNQMIYSFKRQLGKQKDRYESQLNDSNKRFEEIMSRLGKLENPEKPLTRDQFASDDEFIDKLIDQGVERRWAEKEKAMREEYEKYQQQQQEEYEQRKELDEGINKWYPTAEQRKDYQDTVQRAFGEGLKDLLEQERNILDYLFQTPNQSLVLYKLATDASTVSQIFSIKNPLMRLMAVRDLENSLVAERNKPATAPTPAPETAPVENKPAPVNNLAKAVDKPGTQTEAEPDVFASQESLRNFIRSH